MSKRFWSLALTAALITGLFTALPAGAQEAPPTPTTIPSTVQITDPALDSNTLGGDTVGPANVSNVGDILKVWFSNTADEISVHVQTTAVPPAGAVGILFTVLVNPGEGSVSKQANGCLRARLFVPGGTAGGTYQGAWKTKLHDLCNEGTNWIDNGVQGKVFVEKLADATGITTLTFPRSYSTQLADGQVLTSPTARTDALAGTDAVETPSTPATSKNNPWAGFRYDDTKPGSSYTITGGGGASQPEPTASPSEPPGKQDPPGKGKKKGCKKGKGKKKGACGAPVQEPVQTGPAQCPAYTPGDEGKEAASTVVTDAATEDSPLVVELDAEAGLANDLGLAGGAYDETTSVFQNVQVDSASASAGLYAKLSFSAFHDYDLYLNYADGSTAANSGDFNIAPGEGIGGGSPEGAWEAGNDYEQVNGIKTADCAGYTAKMVSYLTSGGTIELSLWLGEPVADPVAPGGDDSLSMFYALMGL